MLRAQLTCTWCSLTCCVVAQEDKREWSSIWRTFKQDPLQPVRDYFHQYVITGIGLFLEGYVVRQ